MIELLWVTAPILTALASLTYLLVYGLIHLFDRNRKPFYSSSAGWSLWTTGLGIHVLSLTAILKRADEVIFHDHDFTLLIHISTTLAWLFLAIVMVYRIVAIIRARW